MRNTFIVALAFILLSICLLSGGCSKTDQSTLKEWQDLLKIPIDKKADQNVKNSVPKSIESSATAPGESLQVSLYFGDASGQKLILEERNITKVEGIARETMEELLKGPANVESTQLFPTGTRLVDINLKPDGQCFVDLSSEARKVANQSQEKLMIYAIANTLGQFPSVKEIVFMINGEHVDRIGGYMNLAKPVQPDYNL
jgi:germination protein M